MNQIKDDHNHNNDQNNDQRLDKVLDASLANYSAVEPRGGLEDRILANLRTQPAATQSSWWSWKWMLAGGAAVAAMVLIALMLSPWRNPKAQESQVVLNVLTAKDNATSRKGVETPPTVAAVSRPAVSRTGRPRFRAVKSNATAGSQNRQQVAAVPHQAVFPSPLGPSEQEKMLLSYVKRTPPEILIALSEEQQQREQEWLDETNWAQKSARKSGSL
jgi:hypothetical protein